MMNLQIKIALIIALLLAAAGSALSQKKVKLDHADKMVGSVKPDGERFDRAIGDVVFKQKETTIYSDSAHFYRKRNYIEAYGNIRIVEGDSVNITAGKLIYEGDSKKAKLRNNVVFTKLGQMTLYTDFLDYDRVRQEARYFNGGKLVDSTNVLTSEKGYYQVNNNMASFKKNVVGKNPDYTLESDTLQYNTETKVVFFRDETQLTNQNGDVATYYEGTYNTIAQKSDLAKGEVETKSYILTGDKLRLDDVAKYYTATGNVEMISKEQDIIITGDDSFYDKANGISKVYGRALMKKIMDQDTMYLTADTLVAIENVDESKKRLLAYNNVKIWKSDLQGIADSLAYHTADSTIFFYDDPVLWTEGNQLEADSINVMIANNTIDRLNLNVNSFVISQDSIDNFNQIKGRKMIARFNKGELHKVDVEGNGESIFFALDEMETYIVGMNRILCSNMVIKFLNNKADNASFYVKPDAKFIPPHELTASDRELSGFKWRSDEKPEKATLLENTLEGKQETTEEPKPSQQKIEPSKKIENPTKTDIRR
ncbi:Organic solvent tolerance protein OstA, partial [Fulvivirga sp. RKSG066]|uniref:OstA-like protein n=1 Tax=Fulvivirga aurantia TaxID=2529383 RepID=UPI0012BC951C